MAGNSFCMLMAGFISIALFGAFTGLGTSWALVENQYEIVPSKPEWILVGGLTATSAIVKVKIPAIETFSLVIDDSDYSIEAHQEIDFSTRATATTLLERQYDIQTVYLDNLKPSATYFYKLEQDLMYTGNSVPEDKLKGSFTTPAPAGTRFNYTIATGGCAWTGSRASVFTEIQKMNPLLFLHLGDLHYADIATNNMDARINAINQVMASDTQAALYRSTSLAYMWDDHDWLGNDSDGEEEEEGAKKIALQSYQLAFPHYPLPALSQRNQPVNANQTYAIPPYHAFTIGTIRYILTDLRSESTENQTYSQEQANWFREELSQADNYDFVIWVTTKPWIGEPTKKKDDVWSSYPERTELSQYISDTLGADNGPQNLLAVSADAHMIAFDNGTNTYYGNATTDGENVRSFPILHSASLDRIGSAKGGPFTDGCYAYEWQRTHQFSTLSFEFNEDPSTGNTEKCIQIDSYRYLQYSSNHDRDKIFSKRLCNRIFATASTTGKKVGTCEIDKLWQVNDAISIAAGTIAIATMLLSCVALQCSDATNQLECCCKSCGSTILIVLFFVLTPAIGFGTPFARSVEQLDFTPIVIVVLVQAFLWFFYLGTWWACCTTNLNKLRMRRDPNDPSFLDVEPNYHIQDINLDISAHEDK